MDSKFHPAMKAIKVGDLEGFKELLKQDPSLATTRSLKSHPTLLQCVALDGHKVSNNAEMAQVLIDAGADVDGPLVACASIGNAEVAEALLEAGAGIDGDGAWSPLEEALYWGNEEFVKMLLERGASVRNLRAAAGLGRMDLLPSFFNNDGSLKAEAGKISWPFGDPEKSNLKSEVKEKLQAAISGWSHRPQDIINNAFIYACMNNHIDAAKFLLQKGADTNAIPPGFDYAGTGLHYAALRGQQAMAEFLLEQGADPLIKDTKVGSVPSGWADYGGHPELRDYLRQRESTTSSSNE